MRTVSANEAKQSFGRMLVTAQREPVIIEKHQQPTVVILSIEEYDRLRFAENPAATQSAIDQPDHHLRRRRVAMDLPVFPKLFEPEPANLSPQEMNDFIKAAAEDDA